MPVSHDVPLTLGMEQVLRRQGIGQHLKLQPEIMVLLRELLAGVNALYLLEPAIAYELHSITEVHHDQLCLEGNAALHGPLLPSVLAEAKELAVVVCTIGPRLEEEVADYFDKKEPLRGLLLDGIGSAAVDSLAREACQVIRGEASSRGYKASSPLNPGMPGWAISEQWHLFRLVPAERIGVRLTSRAVMVPRKSISMVIGIGPEMLTWTQDEVCDRCNLKGTCPYRERARPEDRPEPKSRRT